MTIFDIDIAEAQLILCHDPDDFFLFLSGYVIIFKMVVKEDQERVKVLISDTITLLCRNGLTFKSKFNINALIGITLDEDDVFLLDIRETVKNAGVGEESGAESDNVDKDSISSQTQSRKLKKKRKHIRSNDHSDSDSEAGSFDDSTAEPLAKRPVKQEGDREDNDDLVFIKDEPADISSASANRSTYGNSLYQHQTPHQNSDILGNLAQHGQLYATPAASESLGASNQWDHSSSQAVFSQSAMSPPSALPSQINTPSSGDTSTQVGFLFIISY